MRAKTKRAPVCSGSHIAIELKGLVAPGEALKNNIQAKKKVGTS